MVHIIYTYMAHIWYKVLLKGFFEHTKVFFPLSKHLFKVNILQVFLLKTKGNYTLNKV